VTECPDDAGAEPVIDLRDDVVPETETTADADASVGAVSSR